MHAEIVIGNLQERHHLEDKSLRWEDAVKIDL